MGGAAVSGSPIDRVQRLSDAEQAYIARWVAITHPEIAEDGLAALDDYRRDHADTATLLLGPDTRPEVTG